MTSEPPLLEILERLDSRLADALQTAAGGGSVDLATVDEEVRQLCSRLATAPAKGEREALKEGLARLDAHLGALAALLQKQLDGAAVEIATPGKAAEIYRRTQSRK